MYFYIFVINLFIYYDILFFVIKLDIIFGNFNGMKSFLYLCRIPFSDPYENVFNINS